MTSEKHIIILTFTFFSNNLFFRRLFISLTKMALFCKKNIFFCKFKDMKVFNKWLTLIFVLAKWIIVSYKMKIRYRKYLLQF